MEEEDHIIANTVDESPSQTTERIVVEPNTPQNQPNNNDGNDNDNDNNNDNRRVNRYDMMVIGKYLNTFGDFVNLEKTCKEYRGITEQYRFNPIPFESEKEGEAFKNVETYHLYEEYDPELNQIDTVLEGNAKIKKIIIYEDDDKLDDQKYNDIKGNGMVEIRSNKTGKFKFNMDPSISVLVGVDDNILEDEASLEVKEIVIPYHITKIRENCFSSNVVGQNNITDAPEFCLQLKDIFIPNNVSVICPHAFFTCGISSVNIPSSITFIPEGCFANCEELESIHLPNTIEFLDVNAFRGCDKLKSITLPSLVTSLGDKCFRQCYSLSNVIITSNLVSIGDECFMADGIKHFYSVDQDLTPYSVDLPSTLTQLGKDIFYHCSKITSVRCDIPVIPFNGFCGCDGLRTIRLSYRVTEIGPGAFEDCMKLESVYLPSSLKSIRSYAFQYCRKLSSIHIPSTLTYLGEECFRKCPLNPINLPSNIKGIISERDIRDMKDRIRWVPSDGSDIEITQEKKDPA